MFLFGIVEYQLLLKNGVSFIWIDHKMISIHELLASKTKFDR